MLSLGGCSGQDTGTTGGSGGTTATGGSGGSATGGSATGGGGTGGGLPTTGQLIDRVRIIDADESGPLLGAPDAYTDRLTPLDVAARLQDASKTLPSDYLAFAAPQTRSWTAEERAKCVTAVQIVEDKLDSLGLVLPAEPAEILIARTTGLEEGSAGGYTREGTILLNQGWPGSDDERAELLAHELWHVLSRANPTLSEAAHALVGYTAIPEITLPPARAPLKITNPDAPSLDREIHVLVGGVDTAVVPLLQGSQPYMSGGLFNNFDVWLYDPVADETYTYGEVGGFYEQIGTSTSYNIHPEEISAEHFRLGLFGAPVNDPALVQGLLDLLH